jgi:DHA1 family bicyclomycin/chloramphenicol resistance-like MFS transporter
MLRRVIVLSVVVALLSTLGQLSSTIFTPLSEAMAADLGVETARIPLLVSAFLVAFAISQLVSGPIGDALGYRVSILVAIGFFVAASIYAALAPGFNELLLARVFQGLGAGPALILSRAILTTEVPRRSLTTAFAVQNVVFAIVPALAPILGAWLGTSLGWRSAFAATALLAVTIGLVTMPVLSRLHRAPEAAARRDAAAKPAFPAAQIGLWALVGSIVYAPVFVSGGLIPPLLAEQMSWPPDVLAAIAAGGVVSFVVGGAVIAVLDRNASRLAAAVTVCLAAALLAVTPLAALTALRAEDPAFAIANMYFAITFAGALMTLSVSIAMHTGRDHAGLTSALLGFCHLSFGAAYLTVLSELAPPLGVVSAILGVTVSIGALVMVVHFLVRERVWTWSWGLTNHSGRAGQYRLPLGVIERVRDLRAETGRRAAES